MPDTIRAQRYRSTLLRHYARYDHPPSRGLRGPLDAVTALVVDAWTQGPLPTWTCPRCKREVFGDLPWCDRCGTTRPGDDAHDFPDALGASP